MKKKKGHELIAVFLFIIIVAAVIIGIVIWKKNTVAKEADMSVQVIVEDGQNLVYGQIMEICGNDMTYSTLDNSFQATEDDITLQIPVGTPVITKLGAETTFSRLAVGDVVEMVYDGENIVKVYIVE